MTSAKYQSTEGSKSSNTMCEGAGVHLWDQRPSSIAKGFVGYFGRFSSMAKGQRLVVLAEARGGRFMVAPVDKKRKLCGAVRTVKRHNLDLIQRDFFVVV